ncbi:MAG: putative hydro-lyase [Lautropia sp.]
MSVAHIPGLDPVQPSAAAPHAAAPQAATAPGGAAAAFRRRVRSGHFQAPTASQVPGRVQANIVILPASLADDFLRFCQRNPKPCPILAVGEPGDPTLPSLGLDIDIRTDVPRYRVWRDGSLAGESSDIVSHWRDDLVTFAIGCSFSFEHALADAGIPLRHWACGTNVPMYVTDRPTVPAGRFAGPLVVSMRPMSAADAIRAIQVTSRYASVHGAPVHLGDPALIGITDLARPDFGDPVEVGPGEMPVFWACGVTPQAVVMASRPPLCITHAPGHMLVTDLLNAELGLG